VGRGNDGCRSLVMNARAQRNGFFLSSCPDSHHSLLPATVTTNMKPLTSLGLPNAPSHHHVARSVDLTHLHRPPSHKPHSLSTIPFNLYQPIQETGIGPPFPSSRLSNPSVSAIPRSHHLPSHRISSSIDGIGSFKTPIHPAWR